MSKQIVILGRCGECSDSSYQGTVQLPDDMDVNAEMALYAVWYKDVYCKGLNEGMTNVPYTTFIDWLVVKGAVVVDIPTFLE